MAKRWWWDLSTREFAEMDMTKVVAILPVAAVEQHGPHLPVRVDAAINAGIMARAVELMPDDLPALVLPMQPVGKSNEHLAYPGTLSFGYETLARMWIELGESVYRAGCRRILFVNSHGGQPQVMEIVCRELRVRHGMLAVSTAWFGLADGSDLFSERERTHGIHGGEIETSMMLALHPELVAMQHADDFPPLTLRMEQENRRLMGEGGAGFGWMSQDLHPAGVSGNAAASDAERGREMVERGAQGIVEVVQDMAAFPLERLAQPTAFRPTSHEVKAPA